MDKTRQRTLAIALMFALALAGTFVFAFRAGRMARRIHQANEPIRSWMSIPFIAHAHHIPPETLYQAIDVQPQQPRDRRSVRRLARELNRPVPQLISQLQHAVDAAGHPPAQPPGGPPR